MAALDGKITIEIEYRPCVVCFHEIKHTVGKTELLVQKEEKHNALFHCWSPVTGKAIVEYKDGTVHEIEPQNIRFVDNPMCEYAFPEMKGFKDE
mgnify:CR=1 FL=1